MENTTELAVIGSTLSDAKKQNWLNTALKSHELDNSLQTKAAVIIATLSDLPCSTEAIDIANYETTLKKAKQDINDLVSERKEFTAILDTITANKMRFEKSSLAVIQPFEAALLAVKQERKKIDDAAKAKTDEIARIREAVANHLTQCVAGFETKITNKVSELFEHALTQNIPPESLDDSIEHWRGMLTLLDFKPAIFQIHAVYLTPEETQQIKKEVWEKNPIHPGHFLSQYHAALADKFEFYSISLKNKEDALDLSKKEQSAALGEIVSNANNQQAANRLETISVPLTPVIDGPKTNKLKQKWELDMIDNESNAIAIIAAFSANWNSCRLKLRVKSMFALSVSQMGATLVGLKNDDHLFQCTGIVFKLVEKL